MLWKLHDYLYLFSVQLNISTMRDLDCLLYGRLVLCTACICCKLWTYSRRQYNVNVSFLYSDHLWNENRRLYFVLWQENRHFVLPFMDCYKQKWNVSRLNHSTTIKNDSATIEKQSAIRSKQYRTKDYAASTLIVSWVNRHSKDRFGSCIVLCSSLVS